MARGFLRKPRGAATKCFSTGENHRMGGGL